MAGYYDRLEAQLARATARGAAGGRVPWRVRRPHIRIDVAAVALGVAVVLAVAAVFVGLGPSHRLANHVATPPGTASARRGPAGSRVIRNYAPGQAPALAGQRMWDAALRPPGGGSRAGTVIVNKTTAPNRNPLSITAFGYPFSITASGLPPTTRGARSYAVWIVPAVQTGSGAIHVQGGTASGPGLSPYAQLVGVIKPGPVYGGVSAEGALPPDASGANLLIIAPSGPKPTRIILEAYIEF